VEQPEEIEPRLPRPEQLALAIDVILESDDVRKSLREIVRLKSIEDECSNETTLIASRIQEEQLTNQSTSSFNLSRRQKNPSTIRVGKSQAITTEK